MDGRTTRRAAGHLLVVGAFLLVTCGSPGTATPPGPQGPGSAAPGPSGTSPAVPDPLTVGGYPGPQWYDASGAPLPPETINAIVGPEHCDWESTVFLHVAWPLGSEAEDVRGIRQYVRDPEGVFAEEPWAVYDPTATLDELPSDAEDTGYHTDRLELFLGPATVADEVYVRVDGSVVERWPRAPRVIACG